MNLVCVEDYHTFIVGVKGSQSFDTALCSPSLPPDLSSESTALRAGITLWHYSLALLTVFYHWDNRATLLLTVPMAMQPAYGATSAEGFQNVCVNLQKKTPSICAVEIQGCAHQPEAAHM